MSFFEIEISGGEKPIKLDKDITRVEVKMDTINDNVLTKSNGMLARVKINGKFDEKKSEQYINLFKWAKDFNSKTQYRSVKISVKEGDDENGAVYRSYEFGQMFVVDYKESYSDNSSNESQYGSFELDLTQKDNSWDKVETFAK